MIVQLKMIVTTAQDDSAAAFVIVAGPRGSGWRGGEVARVGADSPRRAPTDPTDPTRPDLPRAANATRSRANATSQRHEVTSRRHEVICEGFFDDATRSRAALGEKIPSVPT